MNSRDIQGIDSPERAELARLIQDVKEFPINYNHYYKDIIEAWRQERLKAQLESLVPSTVLPHLSYHD